MKNKILIFIIGVLVGAIIATIGFYIYKINTTNQETNRPEMMNMGTPPERPDGENMEEPPSMPSDENQNNGTSSSRKQKNKSSNVSTEANS